MVSNSRYIARYFCSLDEPDATRTWFLIDPRTGVPLFKDGALRLFNREEVLMFLTEQQNQDGGRFVATEEAKARHGADEQPL